MAGAKCLEERMGYGVQGSRGSREGCPVCPPPQGRRWWWAVAQGLRGAERAP